MKHPVTSPDVPLIAEADDLALKFYDSACDDLEPEVMRLLALDADESLDALDALTARERRSLPSAFQLLADRV
jgi:hypothetical protein